MLLSPFWTTLLEQQQQQQLGTVGGAGNAGFTAPVTSVATVDSTDPDIVVDNDVYSVDMRPTKEVQGSVQGSAQGSVQGSVTVEKVNVLAKYQLHSVLLELRKLFQEKSELNYDPITATVTVAGSFSSNNPVLDVTRLKRAMVYHTKKYAGYRWVTIQSHIVCSL